jgi:hypothetical protein
MASTSAARGVCSAWVIAGRRSSGVRARKPSAPQGVRVGDGVYRRELAAELGVAELALLEFHLAEAVVLEHDRLEGQLLLHGGGELGHQLGEAAVADDRDRLVIRKSERGRDRERQARRHRSEHAGAGGALAGAQAQMTCGEMGVGAAIERDHGIVRQSRSCRQVWLIRAKHRA